MHDYRFDGQMYQQNEGGSIGLDLTGVVSDIYMSEWDKVLVSKMRVVSLIPEVYKRYKDDINLIVDTDAVYGIETDSVEKNENTMRDIKALAETIDPNLKVTTDTTNRHADRRLPVLDLVVWIGEGVNGETRILYSHYMKDVATRAVINARSCHSDTMKHCVMVNEAMRILRNCSPYLEWQEVAGKLSYFVKRMQFSGYSHEFRHRVMVKALQKHDIQGRTRERIDREEQPVQPQREDENREDEETRQTGVRGSKKESKRWYAAGGKYESVMFVEPTPKSVLKKSVIGIAKKYGLKVRVVERVGATVKGILQRSNPFGKKPCTRDDCRMCTEGVDGVDCESRGCVYQLRCREDERLYRGQTGRSMYERTKEHVDSWNREEEESPLRRHSQLCHDGGNFEFDVNILSDCFGRPSRRMITEAVLIDEVPEEKTMNSKGEWAFIKLSKVRRS